MIRYAARARTRHEYTDHEQKDEIRQQVEKFVLHNHDERVSPHILSLPGAYWVWENRLSAIQREATFLCFEEKREVLQNSYVKLPGRLVRPVVFKTPGHHWHYHGYYTRQALALSTPVENLPLLRKCGELSNVRQARPGWQVAHELLQRPVTAAWLDLCGALDLQDGRFTRFLRRLPGLLDRSARMVPLVITVYNGRDKGLIRGAGSPVEKRRDYIVRQLHRNRAWSCSDAEAVGYLGVGGRCSHMLLFTAILWSRDAAYGPRKI